MTKLGKLWTGAVAYVSLGVGAGLSVAGNLADTYRTRGAATDTLDKFLAAGWPLLVLLAIEMFVSPRWSAKRMFQAWRWLGCLAVGGMAMVVSWTHLHDLMASRGQLDIVAILGPLAIDGMAIMATGLILSTRTRVHGHDVQPSGLLDMPGHVSAEDMAKLSSRLDTLPSGVLSVDMSKTFDRVDTEDMSGGYFETPVSKPWPEDMANLMSWADAPDAALDMVTKGAGDEVERDLMAMSSGERVAMASPLPQRVPVVSGIPDEARAMLLAWDPAAEKPKAMEARLAAYFGKSARTIRRWRTMVLGPVSGPPAP